MKRLISTILCMTSLLSFIPASYASDDNAVRVYINGEILPAEGKLYHDNTVIPVRAFLERAGFTVDWSDTHNMVTASKDGYTMNLWPDSDQMNVNGEVYTMTCPLLEENGTTYAPVRSIGEKTGFTVAWYAASYSAVLSDGSDTMTYYEDASSLLPELGAVVGGAKFTEVAEDETYGMYYTYPNYVEDKAHEYGDYITSRLGYEYDSMLLGENYSKIYVYTLGDVSTEIVVQKLDGVPYIYVYPDTTGDISHAVLYEENQPETQLPPIEQPEIQPPSPENPSDGNAGSELECYPDTDIPKYNAVMNSPLVRTETLEDGQIVYVYSSDSFGAMSYMNYLSTLGYFNYDMDIGNGFNITYTMVKGDSYVVIMTSMFFDEVYVVPGITQ